MSAQDNPFHAIASNMLASLMQIRPPAAIGTDASSYEVCLALRDIASYAGRIVETVEAHLGQMLIEVDGKLLVGPKLGGQDGLIAPRLLFQAYEEAFEFFVARAADQHMELAQEDGSARADAEERSFRR